MVFLEFWLGLAVRYRLPRRKRMKSPSIGLVRDLLFGIPLATATGAVILDSVLSFIGSLPSVWDQGFQPAASKRNMAL